MEDKRKPPSPIAWITHSSTSSLSLAQKRHSTQSNSTSSYDQSIENFDRAESPILPPETDREPLETNRCVSTIFPSDLGNTTITAKETTQERESKRLSSRKSRLPDSAAAIIESSTRANVVPAPAAGMYWSRAMTYGKQPNRPLRAHSANLIGGCLYIFGGCDMKTCFNTLFILDMDTLTWTKPSTTGQVPPPCRAHSCTTVERISGGKKGYSLYIFGGGDGPNYFNGLYVLNIDTLNWTKPTVKGSLPSPRRAHTTCLWNQKIIIIGGGDGARALADVYALDISNTQSLTWTKLETQGTSPIARGYHTSNLIKNNLVVYGGSDGHECFSDIFILDLLNQRWSQVELNRPIPRLAHTTTQVGSYLFVTGGYDGREYVNELLLLNLVTMSWEKRKVYGTPPCPRGYHVSVLYDSRLYVLGGYNGQNVFEDVYILELSACAYLPQITNFDIDA